MLPSASAAFFFRASSEEPGEQAGQAFAGNEEAVVAAVGLDLAEAHVDAVLFQQPDQLLGLIGGIEPV